MEGKTKTEECKDSSAVGRKEERRREETENWQKEKRSRTPELVEAVETKIKKEQ